MVTSGGSFYLSLEFVKNGVGLTVALTAIWLGLRAPRRRPLVLIIAVLFILGLGGTTPLHNASVALSSDTAPAPPSSPSTRGCSRPCAPERPAW